MNKLLLAAVVVFKSGLLQALSFTTTQTPIDPNNTAISVTFNLKPQELVYFDTVISSVNSPLVTLAPWQTDKQPTLAHNNRRKTAVLSFDQTFTLTTTLLRPSFVKTSARSGGQALHSSVVQETPAGSMLRSSQSVVEQAPQTDVPPTDIFMHIACATNKSAEPVQQWIPISFAQNATQTTETATVMTTNSQQVQPVGTGNTSVEAKKESLTTRVKQWAQSIQKQLTGTNSIALRILFALLLGILLSLTPCIYPMIPITVGILQSQGSQSLGKNFALSLAYTLGISTTFSLLGLLAASSGQAFGYLLASPVFVICIVLLLGYFAFSLFGFYNLYIPRFLQQKQSIGNTGGSFLSVFLFGLISGTVASPCLSPGLALILSMVAAMANRFLGFLLLFAFGIGISTPLLIIGTFSGSINLLPRAGMWMIEIQKIFGLMLLGMCFYYLNTIVPWAVTLALLTLFALLAGIYYLYSATQSQSTGWKVCKNLLGFAGVALSVFLAIQFLQEWYYPTSHDVAQSSWYTDYDQAVAQAKKEHKKLLLDFWAPYCSLCKVIAATILKHPAVTQVLDEKYIVVTINGNDTNSEPFKTLKTRYQIIGFPTLLIIDPQNDTELHRWKGEIQDESIEEVVARLNKA